MANYRIGEGGDDGADGLTYVSRLLTIGEYASRAAPGDYGWLTKGVYREQGVLSTSGTPGNEIYLIGDRSGHMTDGVGGEIRLSGSDDDESAARNYNLSITGDYITLRGMSLDTTLSHNLLLTDVSHVTIEDMIYQAGSGNGNLIRVNGDSANITIQRNRFLLGPENSGCVYFNDAVTQRDDTGNIVQNNLFVNSVYGLYIARITGMYIRHNTFLGNYYGIRDWFAHTGGKVNWMYDNIFAGGAYGIRYVNAVDVVEDYNRYWALVDFYYSGIAPAANTEEKPPLFETPRLFQGHRFAETPYMPSEWSALAHGTSETVLPEDHFGTDRPSTNGKQSAGAVQRSPVSWDTNIKYAGSRARSLDEAGTFQMRIPIAPHQMTVSCWVYWDASYTGTKPRMRILEDGQAIRTATAVGSAQTWEQLSLTFTPSGDVEFVTVEFWQDNTAGSAQAARFDKVEVDYV